MPLAATGPRVHYLLERQSQSRQHLLHGRGVCSLLLPRPCLLLRGCGGPASSPAPVFLPVHVDSPTASSGPRPTCAGLVPRDQPTAARATSSHGWAPYLARRSRWDNFSRGTLNQACPSSLFLQTVFAPSRSTCASTTSMYSRGSYEVPDTFARLRSCLTPRESLTNCLTPRETPREANMGRFAHTSLADNPPALPAPAHHHWQTYMPLCNLQGTL
ncbi:hypothetical protein D187_010390 [Cystobacter fuscus DSM 2262]|uniref:Uncharacterized protein n=1 Tax=Cystobacter fuscus (strain ATCC 25194 / DSM 2262 / NBRC 100088 / M29) TaxID=1242864 RepID=S9PFD5_CYSF2|nr:hypothetical protein D187_010390 [Cystobacter fuscus DSM 2262]